MFKLVGPPTLLTGTVLIGIAASNGDWGYAALGFFGVWGPAALFAPWLAKLRRVAAEKEPLPPRPDQR
jgi:hypothetical protein